MGHASGALYIPLSKVGGGSKNLHRLHRVLSENWKETMGK